MFIGYDRERYWDYVSSRLSKKRLSHTLGTEKMAVALAKRYGADAEKASAAALLHDAVKELRDAELLALAAKYGIVVDEVYKAQANLLHGPVAAEVARRSLGMGDEEVLRAIRNHTTGAAGMCPLEKILYLADMIEGTRVFEGVEELRQAAEKGLDQAVFRAISVTLTYLLLKGRPIHVQSIRAYNDFLLQEK